MKNILVVGGTNIDDIVFLDTPLPSDGKANAAYSATTIGGGGANTAIALHILNTVFQGSIQTTLCTKLGQNADTPAISYEFQKRGIKTLDIFEPYSTAIAHNMVISHRDGRSIIRKSAFNHASMVLPPAQIEALEKAVKDADMVFLQTKHPRIAMIAAIAARHAHKPVIVDFSNKECSADLLSYTNFALLPAEFRFNDMPDDSEDADLLYKVGGIVDYAAISSGNTDTKRLFNGKPAVIAAHNAAVKDSLGAGDLRDAAFCFFLMRDNFPDTALRKANIIASISCEYYGREWENELGERLKAFPEFAHDLPGNDAKPAVQPV